MIRKAFLKATPIIDYTDASVRALAFELGSGHQSDIDIARNCFEYVRDNIRHTGDHRDNVTTCKASEVLKQGTGWCYAKSHLLAALLRANGIPTGFCYQRLSCSEYKPDVFCLHGLNAVHLTDHGWFRIDARGNSDEIDARFEPPHEMLAFRPQANEKDLPGIYVNPLPEVITALQTYDTYEKMVNNFPDIEKK